jgi:hypothetical protein
MVKNSADLDSKPTKKPDIFFEMHYLFTFLSYLLTSCPFSLVHSSKLTRMADYERFTNENGQDINK